LRDAGLAAYSALTENETGSGGHKSGHRDSSAFRRLFR
jgi:hypothetical protein